MAWAVLELQVNCAGGAFFCGFVQVPRHVLGANTPSGLAGAL